MTAAGHGRTEQPRLSVYLITLNEEANLGRALESVAWADEIVVLDSGSTDRTVTIARDHDAVVHTAPFEGFVSQKNHALALCHGRWRLNIDADEEVSHELRQSIETLSSLDDPTVTRYEVTRRTRYLGRWIRHCGWYPEYRSRLSWSDSARWTGDTIHESLDGTGTAGKLDGDLLHRPYRDLGDHLTTIRRYADMFAEREFTRGRRVTVLSLLFRPVGRFVRMYVLKLGILDGVPGLIASLMGAWYTFMKYARLYERSRYTV